MKSYTVIGSFTVSVDANNEEQATKSAVRAVINSLQSPTGDMSIKERWDVHLDSFEDSRGETFFVELPESD